jgi:hypothetical protein
MDSISEMESISLLPPLILRTRPTFGGFIRERQRLFTQLKRIKQFSTRRPRFIR